MCEYVATMQSFKAQGFYYCSSTWAGIISIPGSPKTWTWKLSSILQPQITENHKIVPKMDPRRLSKSTLKSIKTDIWATVCPLGVPLDPRITKMVSRVPKNDFQGLQNDTFRLKKWHISVVNLSAQSFPILHSAISSLPIWYQLLAACF